MFIPDTKTDYTGTTFIPDTFSRYAGTTFIPAEERGFFSKVSEAFERGQERVLADIAIYESLTQRPDDLEGALNVRRKITRKEVLDPIEGNWLSDIVYASSRTAAQMWESTKKAGKGALIGAGIGGGVGAVVGAVVPTVGEEPVTIGAGAKIGAKLFAAESVALFAYRQGVGSMYAELIEQGSDPELANKIASIAGIPYALIEVAQLKALSPVLKQGSSKIIQKATSKILGKAIKRYGKILSTEVLEEIGQEIVQIGAEDVSKYLNKQGITIDAEYLKERGVRLLNVAKEATKGFALLPAPGVAIETALSIESANMAAEIEQYKATIEKPDMAMITPEDVDSPISKVNLALKQSIKTYESQEQIRKAERAKRFGEAQAVRESIEGDEWKRQAKNELKGEYTKLGIIPLENQLPLEVYHQLDQGIRISDKLDLPEAINLSDALGKLFTEGKIFRPFEIKLAEKQWGRNIAITLEEIAETIKTGKKVSLIDYAALPKATAASIDVSRTGRQNILLLGDPKTFFKGLVTDWYLLLDDEITARTLEKSMKIQLDQAGDLFNKTGIRWNDWGPGVGFRTGTESFASKIAGEIPGIARSERAFSMGGNYIRGLKLLETAKQRQGIVTTDKQWKNIGHVINILTGEGDPRTFGKYGPILNAAFFAPRLLEARVRAFTDLANLKHWIDPEWRPASKMLAYHVASFVGIGSGILGLMSLVPGVDIEKDPRSTDFGKIRFGNTRIDFWGGYLPLARLVVHLATQQRKTRAGRIVSQEWSDTITKFLQSKLGPAPAYIIDLIKGETFYGDYVGLEANSLVEQFYHRFVPFFIQDVADAIKYQGMGTALATAPLAFHGVGIQTYPLSPGTDVMLKKNELSMNVLGRKWDELGPEVQDLMKIQFPEIETWERKANHERTSYSFISKIEKERDRTTKRISKSLPPDVQKEFDNLMIRPSGISRKISSDWYLNDKKYHQYEEGVSKAYRIVLTKLIRSSRWNKAPDSLKREMLKIVMDEIKTAIRQQIINEANMSDLRQLKRK